MFAPVLRTKVSLLVCCLMMLACSQMHGAESQILVSTWELKQHVRQLRLDIESGQGGTTRLLDRCSQLLNEHPNHLVKYGAQFLPVQKVLLADLRKAGLEQAWIDYADQAAQNILRNNPKNFNNYIHIAQSYPGTPSANQAWQALADYAWDRGQLGSFLYYASQSSNLASPSARKRSDAALSLLNQNQYEPIPENLERVDAIWQEKLPVLRKVRNTRYSNIRNTNNNPLGTSYRASTGSTHVLALSNGTNLIILDPLLGRQIGPLHNLGSNNYGSQSNQAFVGDDIIVATANSSRGMQLLACDRLGNLRWRETIPLTSSASYASRPIILDNMIFISSISNNNSSERIALHAFDLQGNLQWSKTIAQVSGTRNRYRRPIQDLSPDLCVHQGLIALLSNRGVIAQISSNGIIVSLDTYPTKQIDMQFIRNRNGKTNLGPNRLSGRILSNGQQIVAAPIDTDALLIRPAHQQMFSIYQGDGQNGSLLDISEKHFLILDEKIRLFKIDDMSIQWEHDRQTKGTVAPWGRIGQSHTIVAAGEKISTHANDSGTVTSHIDTPTDHHVSMRGELMLFIGDEQVSGRGDSIAFEENLLNAANAAPLDYQPRVALAALRKAQGKSIEAFNFLLKAIDLGAPKNYSENAAQILRPHLYLQLNSDEFNAYLDHFNRLIAIDDNFSQESTWWKARRQERLGNKDAAITLYQQVADMDSRIITLSNRLEGNLSAIAQASINRLQNTPAPWELSKQKQTTAPEFPAWNIEGSSSVQPLCEGDAVVAFTNGFLRCFDAKTGSQRWRQDSTDILPMLGVSISAVGQRTNKPTITVLKGLTADAIGLEHNDTITQFNDDKVNVFYDLIKAVSKTNCGDDFTVTVLRGEKSIELKGQLWAKPMQATQSNANTVLCHNVRLVNFNNKVGEFITTPDVSNTPYVQIYDLASGDLLWHHTLKPNSPLPILTKNDLLIESIEGENGEKNLTARYIRREGQPIAWTVKGRGNELIDYQIVGHVLMSTDQDASRVTLRDMRNGTILFSIPANPVFELVLKGDHLFSMLDDGHLAMWQLSSADMLWSSQEAYLKPIATAKKSVYCRSSRDELLRLDLANGAIQRRYPEWSQVYANSENETMLFIACVNKKHQFAIAGIHKESGNVIWEHQLAATLQYDSVMLPHDNGVYIRLRDKSERIGFVHIDNNGHARDFIPLQASDNFALIGNQVVISGHDGLRLIAPQEQFENRAHRIPTVAGNSASYQTFIKQQIPKLKWTKYADNDFSIFRHNDRIHFVCRFKDTTQRMRLRIGFSGSVFDADSALVLVKHNELIRLHKDAGWQLPRQCEYTDQDNNVKYRAWSMQLPALKPTAASILFHIEQWHATGSDVWWLRRNWLRLEELNKQ